MIHPVIELNHIKKPFRFYLTIFLFQTLEEHWKHDIFLRSKIRYEIKTLKDESYLFTP